jgi:hypothetical protein
LSPGNKSERFKNRNCYEWIYGMQACVSYDMYVKMAPNMLW